MVAAYHRPMATRITPADRLTTVGQHAGMERSIAISRPTVGADRLYSSIVSTAPGDKTRIHHHGDCETSIYILSGTARYTWGPTGLEHEMTARGRRLHLHPGRRGPRRGECVGDRAAGRRADPELPRFARRVPRRRAGRRRRRPGALLSADGRRLARSDPPRPADRARAGAAARSTRSRPTAGPARRSRASSTRSAGATSSSGRRSPPTGSRVRRATASSARAGSRPDRPATWRGCRGTSIAYLGAAADGDGVAILMPDLSTELIAWERPGHDPVIDDPTLRRVIESVARLHAMPWSRVLESTAEREGEPAPPWCPLARAADPAHPSVGDRLRGRGQRRSASGSWPAGTRSTDARPRPRASCSIGLGDDPAPLVSALGGAARRSACTAT